jgi:hypothetical protein
MLLPLMSVSVIASAISKLICPTALYQALAMNFAVAPGMPATATVNRDGAGEHPRTPPP